MYIYLCIYILDEYSTLVNTFLDWARGLGIIQGESERWQSGRMYLTRNQA